MRFGPTTVDGAYVIDIEPATDDRGFFARTYCEDEFREHGIEPAVAQCNVSWNPRRGTLRGMHFQDESAPEPKLIRCTRGAILDVIVDLRTGSATYLNHVAVELNAENRRQLYVPAMCAHGFLTLEHDTEVSYQMGAKYAPGTDRGLRWDDPILGLPWPFAPVVISARDSSWPLLRGEGPTST